MLLRYITMKNQIYNLIFMVSLTGGEKMDFKELNIGYCMCGSFCTLSNSLNQMKNLVELGGKIIPIMSYSVLNTDTRFGTSEFFTNSVQELTGQKIISTIEDAEPIGPKNYIDIMVVAPCTGNTLAKLNYGIVDTPVLMAVKAHLRNNKPVLLAIATNDALSANFENIGGLMNKKNFYFVPFGQDDCIKKPKSMIADFEKIPQAINEALKGHQIQPILENNAH